MTKTIKFTIDWPSLPLRALGIKTILDGCATVSELADTVQIFIQEMEDTEDTQWEHLLSLIFLPVYKAITGIDYNSEKFSTV